MLPHEGQTPLLLFDEASEESDIIIVWSWKEKCVDKRFTSLQRQQQLVKLFLA